MRTGDTKRKKKRRTAVYCPPSPFPTSRMSRNKKKKEKLNFPSLSACFSGNMQNSPLFCRREFLRKKLQEEIKKKRRKTLSGEKEWNREKIFTFPFFPLQGDFSPSSSCRQIPQCQPFLSSQKKLWKGRKNHPGKTKRICQTSFPQVVILDFVLSCLAQSSTFGRGGFTILGGGGVALLFLSSFGEEKGKK